MIYDVCLALLPEASQIFAHIFEVPRDCKGVGIIPDISGSKDAKHWDPESGLDVAVGIFTGWICSGNSPHPNLAVSSTIRNISKRHLS